MKIAIIGTGNLGLSIAKGLITNNAITSLYMTRRNPAGIESYAEYKNVFVTSSRYNMAWAGATWPMNSETPQSINAPRNIIQI